MRPRARRAPFPSSWQVPSTRLREGTSRAWRSQGGISRD
jgi:hypothetical protein